MLDPVCGSGNLPYVSLIYLKHLEHRINLEAEALGLPPAFPSIGPEWLKWIGLSHYAAEMARVSEWIGEIQWMRCNGYEASRNPILRPLGTIERCDTVVDADWTNPLCHEVDIIVESPPFLGDKKMIGELGE